MTDLTRNTDMIVAIVRGVLEGLLPSRESIGEAFAAVRDLKNVAERLTAAMEKQTGTGNQRGNAPDGSKKALQNPRRGKTASTPTKGDRESKNNNTGQSAASAHSNSSTRSRASRGNDPLSDSALLTEYKDTMFGNKNKLTPAEGKCKLEYVSKKIEESEMKIIAHMVCKTLTNSAGSAWDIAKKFGRPSKMPQLPDVGSIVVQSTPNDGEIWHIVSKAFPRQSLWTVKNRAKLIGEHVKALHALKDKIVERNIKKIAITKLGAGRNGIPFKFTDRMLRKIFKDVEVTFVVHFQLITPPIDEDKSAKKVEKVTETGQKNEEESVRPNEEPEIEIVNSLEKPEGKKRQAPSPPRSPPAASASETPASPDQLEGPIRYPSCSLLFQSLDPEEDVVTDLRNRMKKQEENATQVLEAIHMTAQAIDNLHEMITPANRKGTTRRPSTSTPAATRTGAAIRSYMKKLSPTKKGAVSQKARK